MCIDTHFTHDLLYDCDNDYSVSMYIQNCKITWYTETLCIADKTITIIMESEGAQYFVLSTLGDYILLSCTECVGRC